MVKREWEHWNKYDGMADFKLTIDDSVRPIIEAGRAELVDNGHRLTGDVWLEATPGHTPGHTSVRISSGGENAVITGDMIHHPIQIAHPDWICEFDTDPKMGGETRQAFVERYCDKPVTVIGTHFAGPTSGHIVRRNGGFASRGNRAAWARRSRAHAARPGLSDAALSRIAQPGGRNGGAGR